MIPKNLLISGIIFLLNVFFLAANLRKDSDNKMFFAEKIAEKLQEIDVGEIDVRGFCH